MFTLITFPVSPSSQIFLIAGQMLEFARNLHNNNTAPPNTETLDIHF